MIASKLDGAQIRVLIKDTPKTTKQGKVMKEELVKNDECMDESY